MYLEDLLNKHNIKLNFIDSELYIFNIYTEKNGIEYHNYYDYIDHLKNAIINQKYIRLNRWNATNPNSTSIKIEFDLTLNELESLEIKTINKFKCTLRRL